MKELIRVIKTIMDQIDIHKLKTKLSFKKVIKYINLINRVIISYKYKRLYIIKCYKCFKESKKCFVYYYDLIKHDYKFLINLTLYIKVIIKDNLIKKKRTKRLKANIIRKVINK